MADLNLYIATGRIGKDLEMRDAGSSKVLNFSIAIAGTKKDDVTWMNVTAWNKSAEFLDRYAVKGSHIRVSGRIQVREHDGKYYTELVADEYNGVQILSGWKEDDQQSNQNNQQQQRPAQNKQQQGGGGYQQHGDNDQPY